MGRLEVGWEKVACWGTKAVISLKRVKIEEKLLWSLEGLIMEIGEAIKNPAYRIFQTEYSGCLDISAHA